VFSCASIVSSANESAAEPKETTDISIQQFTEQAYETIEAQLKTVDWSKTSLEDIKPEVMLLLEQIERTSQGRSLDWSTLTSRIQLPATIKEDFINWFDARWRAQVQSLHPAAAVQGTQHLSQQLAGQINHYLHHQEKSELSPTEIAQNLTQMVGSAIATLPQPSELANISEISELIDTDTWKQQLWNPTQWRASLEKRKDLTAEEIQQILEWGEQVWEPKVQQVTSWLQAAKSEVNEHLSLLEINLPEVELPDTEILEEARQKIVGQIELAQTKVTDRAAAVKAELQTQADATRRQVAIAAWWLFIALISSGSAAAGAGYLAAIY
ncbi:MAG: hypothetical protein AAFN12_19660, partial [Cyanobacteria bacterium J06560_2]